MHSIISTAGVTTFHELTEQSFVEYGTVRGSDIELLLPKIPISPYPEAYRHINSTQRSWVSSLHEGLHRVEQGFYTQSGTTRGWHICTRIHMTRNSINSIFMYVVSISSVAG